MNNMKKFTLSFLFVALFAIGAVCQVPTGDVSGTIWSGMLGPSPDSAAKIINVEAKDGVLNIVSHECLWDATRLEAPYLYINVPKDSIFEVSCQIVGGNFASWDGTIYYNLGGISVVGNVDSLDAMDWMGFDMYGWGVTQIFESFNNGVENEVGCAYYETLAETPWLKLKRDETGTYWVFISADGTTWEAIEEVAEDRSADLFDLPVKVGLFGANNWGATDTVNIKIDNFKLVVGKLGTTVSDDFETPHVYAAAPTGINDVKKSADMINAFFNHNDQIVVNATENISSIKLYRVDGALIYANNKVSSSQVRIPAPQKGIYLVVAECKGISYTRKVAVN
jgi:hypothetical protein